MKRCIGKIRGSLTIRIFLLTTLILAGACAATYIFLAWATPITYQTIAADDLWEKTERLDQQAAGRDFGGERAAV